MRARPPDHPAGVPRRYRLPLLSAIALTLSFAPWRQEWMVWVAFVPLWVWLSDPALSRRQAFLGLFGVGTIYHISLLAPFVSLGWWGWGTTTAEGLRAYFTYARLFMLVLVAAVSVWGGVVLGFLGLALRSSLASPLTSLIVVPSVWTCLLEYVGHRSVFGFGWGLLGNRLHGEPLIRQTASLAGVYGLSFLVMMVNVVAASWVTTLRARAQIGRGGQAGDRRPVGELLVATAVSVAILAGCLTYGAAALRVHATADPPLRVALLQGARGEYSFDDFTPEGLDRGYLSMLDDARVKQADLLVLPETVWLGALQLDQTTAPWVERPLSPEVVRRMLAVKLGGRDVVVVFGIDAVSGGRTYNTTTIWSKDGLLGVYRKQRLVPFSEYRPALLGRFAPQNLIHGPQFTYAPGRGTQLIRARGMTIGPFICQEVMFPELVRRSVKDGAQLLVTTGNDGVFRSPIFIREQANLAVLRAVENGRSLVRCMKTGISAIIDPAGRIIASAPLNQPAIVVGEVRPAAHLTLYTRFGDWIAGFSALCLIAVGLGRGWKRRRAANRPDPRARQGQAGGVYKTRRAHV